VEVQESEVSAIRDGSISRDNRLPMNLPDTLIEPFPECRPAEPTERTCDGQRKKMIRLVKPSDSNRL